MAAYTDNSGQWHTEYMAKVKTLPSESLRYIIEDCRNAMASMPDNPKWGQYADEVHYCHMEINRRLGK
ncbi:MAG: hypothetical protein VW715_06260 [Rhodospirillales bacterium]